MEVSFLFKLVHPIAHPQINTRTERHPHILAALLATLFWSKLRGNT